jgi:hypothetical protein
LVVPALPHRRRCSCRVRTTKARAWRLRYPHTGARYRSGLSAPRPDSLRRLPHMHTPRLLSRRPPSLHLSGRPSLRFSLRQTRPRWAFIAMLPPIGKRAGYSALAALPIRSLACQNDIGLGNAAATRYHSRRWCQLRPNRRILRMCSCRLQRT